MEQKYQQLRGELEVLKRKGDVKFQTFILEVCGFKRSFHDTIPTKRLNSLSGGCGNLSVSGSLLVKYSVFRTFHRACAFRGDLCSETRPDN
eukprot:5912916-Amphidinium_carterae.2